MVNEHTGEFVTDRALHERCGNGRVHATRQSTDDLVIADLVADAGHLLVDDRRRFPVVRDPCGLVQERFEHLLTVRGVQHLGMPLHAIEFAGVVTEGCDRGVCGAGEHLEPFWGARYRVTVAHPHDLLGGLPGEQAGCGGRFGELGVGRSVLAPTGTGDLATEGNRHRLEAVADTERWDSELENLGVELRRVFGVHARRTPGEHDRQRLLIANLGCGDGVRHDLGIHVCLTHAACDQLRVLRSEIDYENWSGVG